MNAILKLEINQCKGGWYIYEKPSHLYRRGKGWTVNPNVRTAYKTYKQAENEVRFINTKIAMMKKEN